MFCGNMKIHLIRPLDQELADSILLLLLVVSLSVHPSVDPVGMHCVKFGSMARQQVSILHITGQVRILMHGVTVFSPHLFLRAYITSYITSRVSWKLGSFDGNGSYFWISSLVQCSIAGLQLLQSSSVLLQNQNLHGPFCLQPPGPYNCINYGQWSASLMKQTPLSLCKRVVWCKDITLCPLLRDKVFSVVANHVVNSTM